MRLDKLTSTYKFGHNQTPAAYVLIKNSSTVILPNGAGKKQFDDNHAARKYIEETKNHSLPPIEVLIVDSQGKMPKVS